MKTALLLFLIFIKNAYLVNKNKWELIIAKMCVYKKKRPNCGLYFADFVIPYPT